MFLGASVVGPAAASADVGQEIAALPTLDALNRNESPLSNGGKWTNLIWSTNSGIDTTAGWVPANGFPTINGAYWNPTIISDKTGAAAALTMGTAPGISQRYISLWLDMSAPGTAKSGYSLRWTVDPGATTYTVKISKWASGVETVLATKAAVAIAAGSTMALVDNGTTLTAWQGTGSALTEILSATDSTYSSGYAGIEGSGSNSRSTNFKAAALAAPGPAVDTGAASAIKGTGATLAATVNPNGLATTYQFEYGLTASYDLKAPVTAKSAGAGTTEVGVSEPVTGLATGTTYHFRISATSSSGTSKGIDRTFTTVAPPTATTEAASELSATEAKLNASVNPKGGTTTYQFEYGPTTSYGTTVPATAKAAGSGTTVVAASEKISGLNEGTLYHYRVVASNEVGTTYGADATFETPLLPDVTTEAAVRVEANEAMLEAEVDPNGEQATYSFEYGTTPAYGSIAPSAGEAVGEAGEAGNAIDAIRHLQPETTYHYRVVAKSDAGTVKGTDKTFTTDPRTMSPAEEALRQQEENHYTGAADGNSLGSDYMGMMWSGDLDKMATKPLSAAVRHSGAKWLRLNLHPDPSYIPNASNAKLQTIVQEAANRDIKILPYFGWGWPDQASVGGGGVWTNYIKEMVEAFGPNGSYWKTNQGKDLEMTVWEIGNEPNLGGNTPHKDTKLQRQEIEEYGSRFAAAAATAKSAAASKGGSIKVLFSGLFSTSPTDCTGAGAKRECHTDVYDFIRQLDYSGSPAGNIDASYDAISLHPYVLALGEDKHAPTADEAGRVKEITHKKIVEARRALEDEGEGGKNVWITEIGWPTANQVSPGVNPVTPPAQKDLIEKTFEMLKAQHDELKISHLFYYNIQDNPKDGNPNVVERLNWDHFSGLRWAKGKRKPGWEGFANVANGDPKWPHPQSSKKQPPEDVKGRSAKFRTLINTDGSGALTRFQFWKQGPNEVKETQPVEFEGSEGDQLIAASVSGLQPQTTYVYRPVSTNEEEETLVGENETFTTPPSSSTSNSVRRVLHGMNNGYVWVEGWVKEGYIDGPGPGLASVHVHVKIFRNGVYQQHADVVTDSRGHYDSGYIWVGKGTLETRTDFPGGLEWDPSSSDVEQFTVRDGVRIRAQHSGGCWDIFGAYQNNGAAVMHGACNEPPSSNQVFSLIPQEGGQYLQIVARNSGKCVDVVNVSTADGSGLQQYDCLGTGWPNQLFREAWSGNWLAYVAKHSNKCVDVTGGNPGWTNLQQWTCNGNPQQVFRLEPVDSGPIPTQSFLTVNPILHGNGQWYNNWGLATISGHLLAGSYSMANRVVHIQVEKAINGQWVRTDNLPLAVNADGSYRFNDYGLAPGIFRMRTVFSGNGEFGGSETGWHQFAIWQANRLVARHSGRCMSLSANQNVNGNKLIQWDCSAAPSLGDGQTFWFWPVGNNVYEITVISTGKCLDVSGWDNGSRLQQWDCHHGPNQRFQVLDIAGQPGWYAIRPVHQYRCLDVVGGGAGNGTEIGQWDCHWGGNQQWAIQGVIPG